MDKQDQDIGKRLASLLNPDISLSEVSRRSGISRSTLHRVLRGGIPSNDNLTKICNYFSVNSDWLLRGKGAPKNEKQIDVPIVHVHADQGKFVIDNEKVGATLSLPESRVKATGLKPDGLQAVVMPDMTMAPNIRQGDLLICDRNAGAGEGVFLLRLDGQLLCRKMRFLAGKLTLSTYNPEYDPIEVVITKEIDFEVFGRVVGIQQWL